MIVAILITAEAALVEPTLDDLREALAALNRDFPRPAMDPLTLSSTYQIKEDWPQEWPGSRSPGIYTFLVDETRVVYIGKASCGQSIGGRLAFYFKFGPDRLPVVKDSKADEVASVATIAFPSDRAFEAAAVEEFLIGRLRPSRNRNGLGL